LNVSLGQKSFLIIAVFSLTTLQIYGQKESIPLHKMVVAEVEVKNYTFW